MVTHVVVLEGEHVAADSAWPYSTTLDSHDDLWPNFKPFAHHTKHAS
jgi:hypothetical protein